MKLSDYRSCSEVTIYSISEQVKYKKEDQKGLSDLLFETNRYISFGLYPIKKVNTKNRKDIIHEYLYKYGHGNQYEYNTNMKEIADEQDGLPIPFSKEFIGRTNRNKVSDQIIFSSFYNNSIRSLSIGHGGNYKLTIRNPDKPNKYYLRKLFNRKW